jgi:hypothetical protein
MIKNIFWLRTLGIAGILGGIILFAGDLLFYYDPVGDSFKGNMAKSSDIRIILSAITALFATWFYLLGLIPVYKAFKPSSNLARNTLIISFAAILSAYGVIHGAYVAIAISSKLSAQYHLDLEQATALSSEINHILRLFVYPFFALLSFVFIKEVWQRKSHYPRWIIFFFPLIPFPLLSILKRVLTACPKIVFTGGFFNLILILFFTASTIALWNLKVKE